MHFENLEKFYQTLVKSEYFSKDLQDELQTIQDEKDYKIFIQEKLLPLAKSMGYDFSVNDILAYEREKLQNLSEEELESVTGGSIRGIAATFVSVLALAGGVFAFQALNSAHAIKGTQEQIPSVTLNMSPKAESEKEKLATSITPQEIQSESKKDSVIQIKVPKALITPTTTTKTTTSSTAATNTSKSKKNTSTTTETATTLTPEEQTLTKANKTTPIDQLTKDEKQVAKKFIDQLLGDDNTDAQELACNVLFTKSNYTQKCSLQDIAYYFIECYKRGNQKADKKMLMNCLKN